jgi:hypothetical protein
MNLGALPQNPFPGNGYARRVCVGGHDGFKKDVHFIVAAFGNSPSQEN